MTGTTPWTAQDSIEPIQADTIGAIANVAGFNTLAGCDASYSAANMNVTVAAGSITHTNAMKTVAGNSVTLISDPSNPRWTYRYITSLGVAAIVSGSPAAIPAVPDTGANPTNGLDYVQAGLTVANNATYKLDKRVMAPILGYNGGVIVAASTLPITAQMHHVSGTTTITAFPNFASGIVVYLTFDAATPITYNATSMILIGGASITASVGDTLSFRSEGSGNWRQVTTSILSPITLAGSSSAATSTTSLSAVDLVTITVGISATAFIEMAFNARKTAAAANTVGFGLKMNTTVVYEADASSGLSLSSATQRAENCLFYGVLGPRRANYPAGVFAFRNAWTVSADGSQALAATIATTTPTALMPQVALTSMAIRAINNTASNAAEIQDWKVWTK